MAHWTEAVFVDRPELLRANLEARVDDADGEVEDLLGMLSVEHDLEPTTVLDVACGIGRHAVPLAERGLDVTGVDISPMYLERARERARGDGVADRTAFVRGDMRCLGVVDGQFDLVVNLWTSFGYFDDETNRAVLGGMRERVAPRGALVIEMANKEGVLANFDDDGVFELDGTLTAETREYDPVRSRMRTSRDVFEAADDGYEHVGTMAFDLRAYGPAELRERLSAAGFADVALYETLAGEDLTRESARLAAVARP